MAMLHFGLGCVHFATNPELDSSPRKYKELLTATLRGKSGITNVSVKGFEDAIERDTRFAEYWGGVVGDRVTARALPSNSEICFDVFISRAAQEDLGYDGGPGELFRFRSIYIYGLPCTIVSSRDAPGTSATAIELLSLVYRFLAREFPRETSAIFPERLGPSPMHVNFSAEVSDCTELCGQLVRRAYSYDTCHITVPQRFVDIEGSLDGAIGLLLTEQVSHYYALIDDTNVRDAIIMRLDSSVDEIIGGLAGRGFIGRLTDFDARSKGTFAAEKMCYDLAFLDEHMRHAGDQAAERLRIDTPNLVLEPMFKQATAHSMLSPASFRAVLDAARQANTIELQIRTALIAAIAGAIFGTVASTVISSQARPAVSQTVAEQGV